MPDDDGQVTPWNAGRGPAAGGGGMVDSVGMNRARGPRLAIEPERTKAPVATEPRLAGGHTPEGGSQVTVRCMTDEPTDRVQPNGRVRMPFD